MVNFEDSPPKKIKSIKVWGLAGLKSKTNATFGLVWPTLDFWFFSKLKLNWGLVTYYIQLTKVHTEILSLNLP